MSWELYDSVIHHRFGSTGLPAGETVHRDPCRTDRPAPRVLRGTTGSFDLTLTPAIYICLYVVPGSGRPFLLFSNKSNTAGNVVNVSGTAATMPITMDKPRNSRE